MAISRILDISADTVNGWQSIGSATGGNDIYTRYYRLKKFCDPRKKDAYNLECNKHIFLVSGYLSFALALTHGILHTLSDLPTLRRHPETAEKIKMIFNCWNLLTDLAGKHAFISQAIYFLITQIQLGKLDPFDKTEVKVSEAGIGITAGISTLLAILCNTQLRKKIIRPLPPRAQYILHGIFEGLNGYLIARVSNLVVQQIHDNYSDNQWTDSMGGFIERNVFSVAWGGLTGYISGKYTPEVTVADMFGQRAERAGFPLNRFQKISSIGTSLFTSFVFSTIVGLAVENNESLHKTIQATLLGLLALYIPLYYILIRCCMRDHGYGVLDDENGHDDDNHDQIGNNKSREEFHFMPEGEKQKSASPKTFPKETEKMLPKISYYSLNRNVLFKTKTIKSQDRKALAIRRTRRKNKLIHS